MQQDLSSNIKLRVMPRELRNKREVDHKKGSPFKSFDFVITDEKKEVSQKKDIDLSSRSAQETIDFPKREREEKEREPQIDNLQKSPDPVSNVDFKKEDVNINLTEGKKDFRMILVILLFVILLGLGGVVFYFKFYKNKPTLLELPIKDEKIDSDNGGLTDQEELNLNTDPINPDTDGDGMLDKWEVDYNLNPLDPSDSVIDSDYDGLNNLNEFIYQSNPNDPDTDGDGYLDGIEVANHYSPLSGPNVRIENYTGEYMAPPGSLEEQKNMKQETETPQETRAETPEESTEVRDEQRNRDRRILELALEIYLEDHSAEGYPLSLEALVPEYVSELPRDPLVPEYEYKYNRKALKEYTLEIYSEANREYLTKKVIGNL